MMSDGEWELEQRRAMAAAGIPPEFVHGPNDPGDEDDFDDQHERGRD